MTFIVLVFQLWNIGKKKTFCRPSVDTKEYSYRKVPKFLDVRKLCCNLPKIQEKRPNLRVFCQKDANEIANSEDPDQTALFAQTYLSENFGSLR